jgi:hypothetical protein
MPKDYGPKKLNDKGRGMYSEPKNMAPVPKKGSAMMESSPVQNADASKVRMMEREAGMMDSERGR